MGCSCLSLLPTAGAGLLLRAGSSAAGPARGEQLVLPGGASELGPVRRRLWVGWSRPLAGLALGEEALASLATFPCSAR